MSFHASLDYEEEAPRPVEYINRTDQTLKNPLLGTEVKYCLSNSWLPHHLRARSLITKRVYPSRDYYKIFRTICFKRNIYPLGTIIRASEAILNLVIDVWRLGAMRDKLLSSVRYAMTSDDVRSAFEAHVAFQRMIRDVSFTHTRDIGPLQLGDATLDFVQSLVVITRGDIQCLMTYNHFLAAADTAKSRCHLLIAAVVSGTLRQHGSFLGHILHLIKTIDNITASHDDYFLVIKSIYPLVQGLVMLKKNRTVVTQFYNVFSHVRTIAEDLYTYLEQLVNISEHLALEIASVQKSWFFPEIDIRQGSREQFEKMRNDTESQTALYLFGERILWIFRQEFIRGYLLRHSKWPPVRFKPGASPLLCDARAASEWSPEFDRNYEWFQDVIILKTFDLDLDPDFNDIVSDKAVIEKRNMWPYEYNAAAYRDKYGSRLLRKTKRGTSRLVNALIDGKLDDLPRLLGPYTQGRVDPEDCITVLVPKEKELKVKGRFFSKQALSTRIYQVICESTIKRDIMPLLKTHSMTMSSTSLTHLLNKLSTRLGRGTAFVINLDYSSWCNAFRPELQMPLCSQLDMMYGSGYFFRTGCTLPCFTTFLVQDRFYPPRQSTDGLPLEDLETCAQGTLTLGEGMRQKLWTIITACWEIIALREVRVDFDILGQGDNQTIVIYSNPQSDNQDLADRALGSLFKYARKAGHALKVEECWVSDYLYEYGKRMFIDGIPVSGALKQLSRVTDSTGEVFPNLYSKLACLISSCMSAAMSDTSPWVALGAGVILYLIELYIELPPRIMAQEEVIITLACVGPVIGGLPTPVLLPSVFFRGLSDSLPLQLRVLAILRDNLHIPISLINNVVKFKVAARPDWLALVTDPTCLNIVQPLRPERQLRVWVEQAITESTASSKVADFFQQPLVEMAQGLAHDLSSMSPLRPRDMSALFGLSNVAYGLSIVDLFQKSSTIVAANQAIHLDTIVAESQRYRNLIVARLEDRAETGIDLGPYLSGCTYHRAKELRELTWGRPLEGVTMPFVGEQFRPLQSLAASQEDYKDAILYIPQEPLDITHLERRGDQPLYLGSTTSIKVKKGEIMGLNKSRAAHLVRDTLVLWEWYKVRKVNDPHLSSLIKVFLSEKGYSGLSGPAVQGGTLTHRLPSRGDSRQGLTGYVNVISTWLRFTSDYLSTYSHSTDDYTIHFQQVFTYGCLYADSELRGGSKIRSPYLLVASCEGCFEKITEEGFYFTMCPTYQGARWLLTKSVEAVGAEFGEKYVDIDPCSAAAAAFGKLIGESLIREVKVVIRNSDFFSPSALDRLSISDLRRLPWSIVFRAVWHYLLNTQASRRERSDLVRFMLGEQSKTVGVVTRALGAGTNLIEAAPVVRSLLALAETKGRYMTVARILLLPLVNPDMAQLESSRLPSNLLDVKQEDIELHIARARSEYGASGDLMLLETNDYIYECGYHQGTQAYASHPRCKQFSMIKAAIRRLEIKKIYIYPDIDAELVVDLAHLGGLEIVIVLGGDPQFYETVCDLDLCGSCQSRINIRESLASGRHCGIHLGGPCDQEKLMLSYLDNDIVSSSQGCMEDGLHGVWIGDCQVDLAGMCCLPLVDPCPSLFPPVYSSEKAFVHALMTTYDMVAQLAGLDSEAIYRGLEELNRLIQIAQLRLGYSAVQETTYSVGIVSGSGAVLPGRMVGRGFRVFVLRSSGVAGCAVLGGERGLGVGFGALPKCISDLIKGRC
ncbi:TPA_asm: L polymerase [Mexican black-tailed rattlesnake bornavirus]|uniref:RNA-directed RNA polymerase n=1 Tax=Mexican black-tailed rattlesnake bornavirus TaxID=2817571 RepID=A0AAD2KQI5_9MONO|nr:L polymerase [Mexican black-tailed rattlesnake bornavirus]DAZ85319.1 TPA_asm: L polymerase [Mexican black-tailed rattlesnake bornavirus]